MRTIDGFLVLFIIATIFSIAAAIVEEKKLGQYPQLWVNGLRVIHYFAFLLSFSYAYLFHGNLLDLVYLIFMVGLFGHWQYLKNECILGYWENRHYIPGYELGQAVGNNMYIRLIFGDFTKFIMMTFGFLSLVSVFFVVARVKIALWIKAFVVFVMITLTIGGFKA